MRCLMLSVLQLRREAAFGAMAACLLVAGCRAPAPEAPAPPAPGPAAVPAPAPARTSAWQWRSLFDGKTLSGWKVTEFGGGEEEVHVEDGVITLEMGAAELSGITWTGDVPQMDYEVEVEAMRVDGADFFCGLTFPVRDSCCSLIVGGWGGTLVGISSFDDLDASENETTQFKEFESNRWYCVRVRVTEERIEAWIDDELLIEAFPGDRRISVRAEVELSQPLGVCAWNTKAALRTIRLREL